MAETVLEKEICDACQADVRPNSLFCYNCGESVTIENSDEPEGEIFAEDIPIEKPESEELFDNGKTNAKIIKNDEIKPEKPEINKKEKPKLRSAASLKKRGKTIKTKEVLVTWEEHENAPNAWFIAIALFLTLFAVGVFFIAMYLR